MFYLGEDGAHGGAEGGEVVEELEESVRVVDGLLVALEGAGRRELHAGEHGVDAEVLQQAEDDARQDVLGHAHEVLGRRTLRLVLGRLRPVVLRAEAKEERAKSTLRLFL